MYRIRWKSNGRTVLSLRKYEDRNRVDREVALLKSLFPTHGFCRVLDRSN
jgi:uncharacterized protein YegP (UPF0339 family)